jgi:hypothetical protein
MKLAEVHAEVANHCGDIAELFKPGAKVSVLIRNPRLNDGDMIVTDDDMDLVIAAVQRLKEKEEKKLSLEDSLR